MKRPSEFVLKGKVHPQLKLLKMSARTCSGGKIWWKLVVHKTFLDSSAAFSLTTEADGDSFYSVKKQSENGTIQLVRTLRTFFFLHRHKAEIFTKLKALDDVWDYSWGDSYSDQKIHQNNKKYKCCWPNNHDCRVQPNKLDLGYKTKHMTTQQWCKNTCFSPEMSLFYYMYYKTIVSTSIVFY